MWNDFLTVALFILACPVILCGPLTFYLLAISWQQSSLRKRLANSIMIAAMVVASYVVIVGGSDSQGEYLFIVALFWLIVVAVFWLMNIPLIALIAVLRRSDRLVQQAARELERKSSVLL